MHRKIISPRKDRSRSIGPTESPSLDIRNSSPKEMKDPNNDFCVSDISQAPIGKKRIESALKEMSGLNALLKTNSELKPLETCTIICCSNVSAPYAALVKVLSTLGGKVRWCADNAYTTEDDIAASSASSGVSVYAWNNQTEEEYWWCIEKCFSGINDKSNLVLDENGILVTYLHEHNPSILSKIEGIVEKTKTGIQKLYNLLKNKQLAAPAMNIRNSVVMEKVNQLFYTREVLLACLDLCGDSMISGRKYLICGYGNRGKGCCKTLRSYGAVVYVSEVDPICALQAVLDGIEVVQMDAVIGFVHGIITCTETKAVLNLDRLLLAEDGCIVINFGSSSDEIDTGFLNDQLIIKESCGDELRRIELPNHKTLNLLFDGNSAENVCFTLPINLISFQTTASVVALMELHLGAQKRYQSNVYLLPKKLDEHVASLHLESYGVDLTQLTDEQASYMGISKTGPFKAQLYRY